MERENILFSTTRQWNPGDEVILFGCENILRQIWKDSFNSIIFNRNPDVRVGGKINNKTRRIKATLAWDKCNFKGKSIIQNIFRIGQYDNSFKDGMNPHNIDLVVFAGSPEWYGSRLKSLYQMIEEYNIPTLFLGLGAGDSTSFYKVNSSVDRVLKKALSIFVRDYSTETLLKQYGAKYLPCPALLSAPSCKIINNVNYIGLIYATSDTLQGNKVSPEMHSYIVGLYKWLMTKYPVAIVCHYIDEADKAREDFPEAEIYYSFDSREYISIYENFDLVIGGRVHGIGIAASLGIPGIMIKHNIRSDTTDGFFADSVTVGESYLLVAELIDHIMKDEIRTKNQILIEHKSKVQKEYEINIKKSLAKTDYAKKHRGRVVNTSSQNYLWMEVA